jgi:hypothetical protein
LLAGIGAHCTTDPFHPNSTFEELRLPTRRRYTRFDFLLLGQNSAWGFFRCNWRPESEFP